MSESGKRERRGPWRPRALEERGRGWWREREEGKKKDTTETRDRSL
jgi:hypothetical protein